MEVIDNTYLFEYTREYSICNYRDLEALFHCAGGNQGRFSVGEFPYGNPANCWQLAGGLPGAVVFPPKGDKRAIISGYRLSLKQK